MKADQYMKRVRIVEERLSLMEQKLRSEIAQTGKPQPISLCLELKDIDERGMQIIERNTGHVVMVNS